ncbi:MAG: rhodanese-like domain-containing protein [Crocinitomicaceae bacterium]|jgi:rhodanese-related sulfurtransferase
MKILSILLLLIPYASIAQSEDYKNMLKKHYNGFSTISPSEAKRKLNTKGVFFLDTRTKSEFSVSHLKNAIQIGSDNFIVQSVSFIPKNAEIIIYCSIGQRSQVVGEKMKVAGYTNIKNLYGGLFHWININYPLVDLTGTRTKLIHGYSKEWGSKWVKNGSVVY